MAVKPLETPVETNSIPTRDAKARWSALQEERSSWVDHWQEISTYLLPRSGRFVTSDRNKGERNTTTSWTLRAPARCGSWRRALWQA